MNQTNYNIIIATDSFKGSMTSYEAGSNNIPMMSRQSLPPVMNLATTVKITSKCQLFPQKNVRRNL